METKSDCFCLKEGKKRKHVLKKNKTYTKKRDWNSNRIQILLKDKTGYDQIIKSTLQNIAQYVWTYNFYKNNAKLNFILDYECTFGCNVYGADIKLNFILFFHEG